MPRQVLGAQASCIPQSAKIMTGGARPGIGLAELTQQALELTLNDVPR